MAASALDLDERERRAAEYAATFSDPSIPAMPPAVVARDLTNPAKSSVSASTAAAPVVEVPIGPGADIGLGTAAADPRKPVFTDPLTGAPMQAPPEGGPTLTGALRQLYTPTPAMPAGPPAESGGALTGPARPVTPEAPATPASSALTPGGAITPAAATTSTEEEPVKVKGARPRQAAVAEREEFPGAVPKAVIDPQYLVRLEQSNKPLHDAIVSAAARAGVGSWDYANLIYATTKGDPNFQDKDGRTGIAGLKPEDVARYQRAYPELFKDEQGNPVDPRDPATNLLLGAQKFRELRDRYGANTANSIAAYYHDPDKIDHAATLTPAEQRRAVGDDGYRVVRQAIGGPDAEKGEAKALQLNPAGTLTAPRVIEAAVQSARNGLIEARCAATTRPPESARRQKAA